MCHMYSYLCSAKLAQLQLFMNGKFLGSLCFFCENISVSKPIFHAESKDGTYLFSSHLVFLQTLLLFSMKSTVLVLGKTCFLP